MTNRQYRNEYMTRQGYEDGKTYNWLYEETGHDGIMSIEGRAALAWMKCGYTTHRKQFIKGYIQGAADTRKIRQAVNSK